MVSLTDLRRRTERSSRRLSKICSRVRIRSKRGAGTDSQQRIEQHEHIPMVAEWLGLLAAGVRGMRTSLDYYYFFFGALARCRPS